MMGDYEVKGGEKRVSGSGMERHVEAMKIDYSLAMDGPMFERLAIHLSKALKVNGGDYDERNWMKANTQEDADRFRRSAVRHFYQWMRGDTDEDHAAAALFNINGYEYTKARLADTDKRPEPPREQDRMANGGIGSINDHCMTCDKRPGEWCEHCTFPKPAGPC